jgi:hypothetical protein
VVTANTTVSMALALVLLIVVGGLWFALSGRALNRRGDAAQR